MKIESKKIIINKNEIMVYRIAESDKKWKQKCSMLQEIFQDQGNFYEKVFGVSRTDAELAGWSPEGTYFSLISPGWNNFLRDRGKIDKKETTKKIDVIDIKKLFFN